MASGGFGVAKYLKRSMDRSRAFVTGKRLKPDSYKSKPKKRNKRKLHIHSGREIGVPSKEITWTSVFRTYLLVSMVSLLVFPFVHPLFRRVFYSFPNGDMLLSIFEFIVFYYFAFIAGSAVCLLFFYLFKNLWDALINRPVKINQKMKEVKLHIERKQKKRRFRKPALVIQKKVETNPGMP